DVCGKETSLNLVNLKRFVLLQKFTKPKFKLPLENHSTGIAGFMAEENFSDMLIKLIVTPLVEKKMASFSPSPLVSVEQKERELHDTYKHDLEEAIAAYKNSIASGVKLLLKRFEKSSSDQGIIDRDKVIDRIKNCDLSKEMESGKSLQEIFGFSHEDMQLFYSYAINLYEDKQYDDCQALFLTLTCINPMYEKLWYGLASVMQAKEQFTEASTTWEISLAFNPNNPETYFHLAECLTHSEQYKEAREVLGWMDEMVSKEELNFFKKENRENYDKLGTFLSLKCA
ncbi:MAG: tetratricopeptide repeat protein, partial [Waddliaceae bacterium]